MKPFDFGLPKSRGPGENIVPMINVVFLLLIFFMMTATIQPPMPVEADPPITIAEAEPVPADRSTLYIGADGRLVWGEVEGRAALDAFLAAQDPDAGLPVTIRADRRADSATLAALLAQLSAAGLGEARLVVIEAGGPLR